MQELSQPYRKGLQLIFQVSFIDHKLRASKKKKKNSLDQLQTKILLYPSLVHKFTSLHMMEREQRSVNLISPSLRHGHWCGVR